MSSVVAKRAALLSRLSVRWQINSSFGVVLALMLAVSAIGYVSLNTAIDGFSDYARVTENAQRVQQIERNVVAARADIYAFIQSGDAQALARIREVQGQLRTDTTAYIQTT